MCELTNFDAKVFPLRIKKSNTFFKVFSAGNGRQSIGGIDPDAKPGRKTNGHTTGKGGLLQLR
jgi:hypothetical protein